MKRFKVCEKCGTKMSEVKEYNGRYLCIINSCYAEEQEKDSGKIENDLQSLEEYRALCRGTENNPPSSYD